jgi:hypothetical protein
MYLVATALGLAGCAVGGGESSGFARAAGIEEMDEPQLGEFALGAGPMEGQ